MIGLLTAALADAARFERDRRAANYPDKIAAAQRAGVGPDGRATEDYAEALTIDFQCWVAIAEWLESDRFFGFHGGAEPERVDAPWISWPQLEAAAERAIGSVKGDNEESLVRRARLVAIHAKLQRMRDAVASINAELRQQRVSEAA